MQEFSPPLRKLFLAQAILLLAIAAPAFCQSSTPAAATASPQLVSPGDICNSTKADHDIVGQTPFNATKTKTNKDKSRSKSGWRPAPVTEASEPKDLQKYGGPFHRDYLVLVYDSESHKTAFYDYDTHHDEYTLVPSNGAFLPIVYTKEKFLVRVCNLHPTDTVSIAGNSFTLPEQGADIRGTALTSVPALAPTLDTLGSANAAGLAFSPAGVNFGNPAPLTSIPVSGFTLGSANKDTGYTDAVITVSPEALAFETVSLIRDAQDTVYTTKELNRGDESIPGDELEGSIASLQGQANRLRDELEKDPNIKDDRAANLGWFNQRLAETQQFVTELNGLTNGVSQAGFGARAVAIRQNFESILGILKQIHRVIEDDKEINKSDWTPAAPLSTDTSQSGAGTPKKPDAPVTITVSCQTAGAQPQKPDQSQAGKNACPAVQPDQAQTPPANPTLAKTASNKPQPPKYVCQQIHDNLVNDKFTNKQSVPADTFTCRAYEQYIMETFLERYNQKVDEILSTIATAQAPEIATRSSLAFKGDKDTIKTAADSAVAAKAAAKDALDALNEAAREKTHSSLLKYEADQAVLKLLKPQTAVENDKTQVAKLRKELRMAKASEDQVDALLGDVSALEQKLPQPAQDLQASLRDVKLSAAFTVVTAQDISADPANSGTPDEKTAKNNASYASSDEKKVENLAKDQPQQEPQPAPEGEAPQTLQDHKQPEGEGSANATRAAGEQDKLKQDEAAKAKKDQATKAVQAALDKATTKQDHDEETLILAQGKAVDAVTEYENENRKANTSMSDAIAKFKEAKTKADIAGKDADSAANDLPKSDPKLQLQGPEEAKSLARQWHKAAEDIETYVAYLNMRFPEPATNGESVQTKYGEDLAQKEVLETYYEILKMRSDLTGLDQQVSTIFKDLNDDYRDIRVEQTDALPPFTGNTIERVSINVQRNYTPFTITGGASVGVVAAASSAPTASPSGGSSGAGGGGGKGSGSGSSGGGSGSGNGGGGAGGQGGGGGGTSNASAGSPSGSNDITVLLEVHRRATFNMVGGVMSIFIPTNSYAVVPEEALYKNTGTTASPTYQASESCDNGTATTVNYVPTASAPAPAPNQTAAFYCVQASQTGSVQVAGMAGLEWFPRGRDYFPHGRGVGTRKENWWPAALFASSVTSLGSAFAGGNLEPVNGLNFFAGVASAHQQTLPSGVLLTNVYQPVGSSATAPAITPVTNVKWGLSFGVGFDLSVFTQLFTKTASPQLP